MAASMVLARVVAAVMPTSGRAVMLATILLAFGDSAHAACDAMGFITGANGPIVLGTAGCATNPGVMSGTIESAATVAAPGTGVASVASPGWTVTNQGIITAGGNGITGDVSFTLKNSGTITAGDSGALIGGGSTVINLVGGTITGDFTGLSISDNGGSTSGGPSTVDNAGTITSTSGFNDAIDLGLGGAVTNRSTGTISATGVGVAGATNPTTVNNFGQILDASTGVGLSAGGTVTNNAGAIISTTSRGVDISGGVGVVVNSGSILASAGRAVQLQAGGSVTNTSTGTITSQDGGTRAVFIFGGPGAVINAGAIDGGVTAAVEVESTGSSITNSGTIHSPSGAGIQLDPTSASNTLTTIVNDSAGVIQGAVNALVANGNASVDFTNRGAVIGNMVFGAGDVALHFYTGSSLIGDLTAGTGTNTIGLNGSGNDTFSSPIANFQTITKLDDGTWTLSGAVSGPTALIVAQGTLILSAANTYTGGTIISGGTLQLGNGATTGAILGNVLDNGTLAFDRSDPVTFTDLISGTGSVSQIGTGSTTLAANTYSGGTLLAAGALIAGDNSAFGTGALTVAANAAGTTLDNTAAATALANPIVLNPSANLTVAGSNPLTLAGVISGDGALTKNGASTLILASDNSYAGGTTVNAGTLQVGAGGATGSVGTGPVLDSGALVFNRSGTVAVPGAITGTGSLTQAGVAAGTLVLTGDNTYSGGTTIASGILQLGNNGATGSIIDDVKNNGALAFDHSNIFTFAGVISGPGGVTQIGPGTTILTADNPYTGGTAVSAGALAIGDFAHPSAALSGGGPIAVASDGALGGYGSVTGSVVNSGVIAAGSATPGLSGSPTGTFTINGDLLNRGAIQLASGASIGNVLEVRGSYVGAGGTMAINTFLGGDGSPSDRLVINGDPVATGNTLVHVTNVGGPGAQTTGNGILVVNSINGATTAPGAFTLTNGELRAGAFDYDLFRGGVSGSPDDWFLRSSFIVPPAPPILLPTLPPMLPTSSPPNPLPPGVYPIIGPGLATYGVVQPLARQLGLSILGTLDDRVSNTFEQDPCAVQPAVAPNALPTKKPAACPLLSPSVWGRFFGQTIDNRYQAFADPHASGNLGGFQGGIDLLRGSLIAGQYEQMGLYGAYGDVSANVDGLVANPAATAYINTHTGSANINAWSGGAYWTHVGPRGWYLDAVLQGTSYGGSATTQFARLDTDGWGFIASLEGGIPFALPQLGPGFVIEPQGQIAWQKVSFGQRNDGLGEVALGDTTGTNGRLGLRGKWTIVTAEGPVLQPYVRGNLWQDWGPNANTVYSGTDMVPLVTRATLLEFGGGLTGRINANVSLFTNVDYEFAVGAGENQKRNGIRGAFGARYTW